MLEDSFNLNPLLTKVYRYKSAKAITTLNYNYKTKENPNKKRSHSYDHINKKSEAKANISKNFPVSESYSILSNSREDIKNSNLKTQSIKCQILKKSGTFDKGEQEMKKNSSINELTSADKLREELLENKDSKNLRIKIKRPNFLIKSCFYNKNSDIYQSKIGKSMSKRANSPVFNFFRDIDVEPNIPLLKKNYKLSSFGNFANNKEKKLYKDNNNILNDVSLNENDDMIKIIKADSSDEEKEVKSFFGDINDFANEIEKINKMKDKEDTLNDSIRNNNSINISAQNLSEGLNNSIYLNRSLNEEFVFKNHSKIFKSNVNNLSMSLNNSLIKAQEEKINNIGCEYDSINQDKNDEIKEKQEYFNENHKNFINNLNYTNSINLSGFQNYETGKNIKNQDIINNNIINNNKNPFQNVINNFNLNNESNNNYSYKFNNNCNQNNLQHPCINNTINYIFQNNTNLFYNNNPFYLNNNVNPNIAYNYFPNQYNNNQNLNFQPQFNQIIKNNILNNYYNQNNNIFNYSNNSTYKNNHNYNYNINRGTNQKINKKYLFDNYEDLSKISNIELAKISHILSKKKEGSRYLENIIESNPSLASSLFFPHSLAYFEEISNNKYGNFYIKKIIKYLNKECLYKLIEFLNPLIIRLGTNQYGSKIIEQLIKSIKDDDNLVLSFIQKIIPNLILLINDINGTHIIYKLLLLKSKSKNLVEEHILKNIKSIYISREGCNLLKKYFDLINKDCNNINDYTKMLLFINIINNNLPLIITDQFGNYLIRHIVQNLSNFINEILFKNIINNLNYYSNQKYSSNVVENCLDNLKWRDIIIDEFCKQYIFNSIFLNEYGNYVIQKVLSLANEDKKNILFNYIIQVSQKLQALPFGPKLISKLVMNYPKLQMYFIGMKL